MINDFENQTTEEPKSANKKFYIKLVAIIIGILLVLFGMIYYFRSSEQKAP